jgi:glutamine---fructose-6-phosphate transaminase (isomerizing)
MSTTYQEIMSQPDVWRHILNRNSNGIPWYNQKPNNSPSNMYFIGCGTSYYLAVIAASIYSRLTGACARGITSSDVMFFPESINAHGKVRAITISRSGETTETVWATKHLCKLGIRTLALTCQQNSSLSKQADASYVIDEANEVSVVMTRSFTGMLLVIQKLAALHSNNKTYLSELEHLPEMGTKLLNTPMDDFNSLIINDNISMVTYLGQGAYYGLASESMLKMKEMAITNTEVFHTLEFRHGPKSVIDTNSLVIILLSDSAREHEIKLAHELKEQGAFVGIIGEEVPSVVVKEVDASIELKSGLSEYTRIGLYMIITQLLAYQRAVSKRINPDKPMNLSKVVTL